MDRIAARIAAVFEEADPPASTDEYGGWQRSMHESIVAWLDEQRELERVAPEKLERSRNRATDPCDVLERLEADPLVVLVVGKRVGVE